MKTNRFGLEVRAGLLMKVGTIPPYLQSIIEDGYGRPDIDALARQAKAMLAREQAKSEREQMRRKLALVNEQIAKERK